MQDRMEVHESLHMTTCMLKTTWITVGEVLKNPNPRLHQDTMLDKPWQVEVCSVVERFLHEG